MAAWSGRMPTRAKFRERGTLKPDFKLYVWPTETLRRGTDCPRVPAVTTLKSNHLAEKLLVGDMKEAKMRALCGRKRLPSNTTPHADARDQCSASQGHSSRAPGGRER